MIFLSFFTQRYEVVLSSAWFFSVNNHQPVRVLTSLVCKRENSSACEATQPTAGPAPGLLPAAAGHGWL